MRNNRKRRKQLDPENDRGKERSSTEGQNIRPLNVGQSRQETIATNQIQDRINKDDKCD
jgi:hypothetical protein